MKTFAALAFFLSLSATAQEKAPSVWFSWLKILGDVRLRHEYINNSDLTPVVQHRSRLRARLGAQAKVAEGWAGMFQIASGQGDPVSTNETFDGGFVSKDIRIDLAFVDWKVPWEGHDLTLTGGKMKNPFANDAGAKLVWDGDLNPEGLAAKWKDAAESLKFGANAGLFFVDESFATVDQLLVGVHAWVDYAKFTAFRVRLGMGYNHYARLKSERVVDFSARNRGYGNQVSGGLYASDFRILETWSEVSSDLLPFATTIFFHHVRNTVAPASNTGWMLGLTLGNFRYSYRELEREAVLGAFADSDMGGGGTDRGGHEFSFFVEPLSNVRLEATYLLGKTTLALNKLNYHRVQLDASVKF